MPPASRCITPSHTLPRRTLIAAGLLGACASAWPAPPAPATEWPSAPASATARQLVRWVLHTGDAHGMPFVVIDKTHAQAHVFGPDGQWLASTAVLLGAARGDRSTPGIGDRPLHQIPPHERTTPAGRFDTEPGRNLQGEDLVWIDYDGAVSMHRVRSASAAERRHERLASPQAAQRRISWGCVNVPTVFYNRWIAPTLGQGPGVAYVLPDTEPMAAFFAAASQFP